MGRGRVQIETALQAEFRRPDGARERTILAPTLLRVGVTAAWEVRVETNGYAWDRVKAPSGGTSRSEGGEPLSVGVKYHIRDGAGRIPSLGLIARAFPPSGSGAFRTEHLTGDLRLAADWDLAPQWSLNPNVGVASYEDGSGRTYEAALFASTLSYNPSPSLNLFVDAAIQSPEAKHGRTSIIYDAGGAILVGHEVQLDISVGTGAGGDTPPHPFIAAGVSRRF